MLRALFTVIAIAILASPAEARRHRHNHQVPVCQAFDWSCSPAGRSWHVYADQDAVSRPTGRRTARRERRARTGSGAVIGGRPSSCPRAYCGCATSLEHFGRIVPGLNLARAWFKFPRAAPAPNMVAVRRGHVFTLKEHISGSVWKVLDPNSGRGLTRLHERSISGFVIVNPRG